MQRSSVPFLAPNTFRDSNEITTKHELVQPSVPTGERMDFNSTTHRSIIQPVEDDDHSISSSHQITNKPFMRSIIRSNGDNDDVDDDGDNTPDQEQIQNQRTNNDNDLVLEASGYDQSRLADLSADEAFARQLQEEEYSKDSLATHRHQYFPFRIESDDEHVTATASSHNPNFDYTDFQDDIEYAAYLQQQGQTPRHYPRNAFFVPGRRSSHTSNEPSQSNEDENERMPPPFAQSFSFLPAFHNEDDTDEENPYMHMPNPFAQFLMNRNRSTPDDFHAFLNGLYGRSRRRPRTLQDTEDDFGPEDYERLLQLDETVRKKKLTKEQINSIPIESFHRTSNNTDEENKCGICLEQFEVNQTLRRFPCRHIYHKECGDRWLQENNACPICREAPIKVQSGSNTRQHRHTTHQHHHNHHHNSNTNPNSRRSTHSNRNLPQPPTTTTRTTHMRRGGPSQRPS